MYDRTARRCARGDLSSACENSLRHTWRPCQQSSFRMHPEFHARFIHVHMHHAPGVRASARKEIDLPPRRPRLLVRAESALVVLIFGPKNGPRLRYHLLVWPQFLGRLPAPKRGPKKEPFFGPIAHPDASHWPSGQHLLAANEKTPGNGLDANSNDAPNVAATDLVPSMHCPPQHVILPVHRPDESKLHIGAFALEQPALRERTPSAYSAREPNLSNFVLARIYVHDFGRRTGCWAPRGRP